MNENKVENLISETINRLREDFKDLRQEFKDLRQDVSDIKTDVAWIKGKLEGRAETRHVVLTGISIAVAIGAVIVAILK